MEELKQAKKHLDAINNYKIKEYNYTNLFDNLIKIVEKQEKEITSLKRKLNDVNGRLSRMFAKY